MIQLIKRYTFFVAAIFFSQLSSAQKKAPIKPENKDVFIKSLIGKMTLEEKVGQLTLFTSDMSVTGPVMRDSYKADLQSGKCGNIFNAYTPEYTMKLQKLAMESRLKIPLLFGYDVIHGHKTIFPIPLGESCAWDTLLSEQTAGIAATEAAADGLHWTYSPMVDISRDPRWGRVAEGSGEDPYIGSLIARAKVKGYQENIGSNSSVLACVKHFALYGAPIAGRDYNTVDMGYQSMYNVYFPPYKAAIDAGARSVMASFNEINGIPSTANKWLMNDVLRKDWGFKGFIVTDYTGINEMVHHGNVADEYEGGIAAINAGIDMDMQGAVYYTYLKKALDEKKVNMEQIDLAVYRILEAKYDLGLFSNPYKFCSTERAKTQIMNPSQLAKALEAGQKSIVLLKNQNNILPLKKTGKYALIGPYIKDKRDLIGNWSAAGDWTKAVSLYEALNSKIGSSAQLIYAQGANTVSDTTLIKKMQIQAFITPRSDGDLLQEALIAASQAEVIILALGETEGMTGEAASRSNLRIPANQIKLMEALRNLNKPIVLVLSNGRPLDLSWENENMNAILETWFLGTQSGNAISSVLLGEYNPQGRLTMSFPRSVGQVPIFYSAKNTGRPYEENQKYTSKYLDIPNTPLFPFGYGLSYSQFSYSNLSIPKKAFKTGEKIELSLTVSNSGKIKGIETVQFYVRDNVGSSTRPVKELKRFVKLELNPGESKNVVFTISSDDLKYYNYELQHVFEPGEFTLFVGKNSSENESVSIHIGE